MRTKRVLSKIAALGTGAVMMGATMSGAFALDYTLADYPAPFVTNGIFSGVMAVGDNAAAADTIAQSVLLADLQTKAVSPTGGTTVTISGGVSEDIPLGGNISDAQTYTFDQELADDDVDSLIDASTTFQSTDYEVEELFLINQRNSRVEAHTSLSASEDDYQTDVVLEVAKDGLKYYYAFSEKISPINTTSADPLEIKFLGKTLKVTSIDSDTKFTATVGTEYFLDSGDSVVVEGKTVKLARVGSSDAVVVDVDGVTETISGTTTPKTINGIEIKVDDTFYDSNNQAASAATLVIGKEATETYTDGDAYIGEDEDNPDWVWNVGNLQANNLATTTGTEAEFTGPYFGIENDFIYNDDSDNPPKVGECLDLPNNYLSVCMDSLTVSDDPYATYTFEYEDTADFSDAIDTLTSENAIFISTSQAEGIEILRSSDGTGLNLVNGSATGSLKAKKVWLYTQTGTEAVAYGNSTDIGVYYEDTNDNKIKLAGTYALAAVKARNNGIFRINYDNTKDTDVQIYLENETALTGFNLVVVPFHSTNLPSYNDNITMNWTTSGGKFNALGSTQSSEEAGELNWQGSNSKFTDHIGIGNKDEDHRTRYGIIIRDPKSHGASDEVLLDIPGNQVQANVVIKGSSSSTSSTGGAVIVNPIPSSASALVSEVTSPSAQNLIVVGGPAVNNLAGSVFGLSASDFTPNEAMVKLADNGNNVALLVAGYSATDTRNAAESIAAGKLAGLSKAEAKVTSATQTVGTYAVE